MTIRGALSGLSHMPCAGVRHARGSGGAGTGHGPCLHRLIHRPARLPRAGGFTLVELLAVVALIGLATTTVLLTLPDGDAALYRQADGFGLALRRAQEEAILGGRAVRVGADAGGYRFGRQEFGRWRPLDDGPFAPRHWSEGVQAVLPQRQQSVGFRFDPTGAAEPQQLLLVHGQARVWISVDPGGQVRIDGRAP